MSRVTLDLPDAVTEQLERLAADGNRSVEDVVVEQLCSLLPPAEEGLEERYKRWVKESGLFIQVSEEEKKRYPPPTDEEREQLAQKLSVGKPLSEIIIEERGPL